MNIHNPYEQRKPYPYKASLHNHTQYTSAYTHAPVSSADRLKEYRDYETEPRYGIVSITEHDRLSTPWNTNPPCNRGVYEYDTYEPRWGVDGILWIPGMERIIGQRDGSDNQLFGEIVCIGCDPQLLETEHAWSRERSTADLSGWFYETKNVPASAELTFVGTGVQWIARTYASTCIAEVMIDGEVAGRVDLFSEDTRFQQTVFSIDGLGPGTHTIRIVQTDEKNEGNTNRFVQHLTLDAFIVTKQDGSQVVYGADHPEIQYRPLRHRYDPRPGEKAADVMTQLRQDGIYVALSHPNARLETSGKHKGKQIWSSAGYTYEELDTIFGNAALRIPPWPKLPNAIEIGNAGYDLRGGQRTNWTNAEAKWDYLLSAGHRVHGIASDDAHGAAGFGGWCVIYTNAPTRRDLTVEDVLDSLFQGSFYASQGPAIENICVEDESFYVETDVASTIEFISQGEVIARHDNVQSAKYAITGDERYVRARVTRSDRSWREIGGGIGKSRSAWTNPIYVTP